MTSRPPADAVALRLEVLRAEIGAVRETLDRRGGPAVEPLPSDEIARRAAEGAAAGRRRIPPRPDGDPPPGSLAEALGRIRSGEVSAAELAAESLERAWRASDLNAFLALAGTPPADDDAREKPLGGLPLSVKDIFDVAGWETTSGSRFPTRPAETAPAWEHLAANGATLLGKTNLHEWAFGVSGNNPHFGPVRNPHDPERIAGGSSSGSAASLAAGIGYGSLGSDTGGSIRIPAALTGTFGLKPSFGRLSRRGVTPLSRSIDHVGPMARSAADLALLWAALSGEGTGEVSTGDAPESRPLAGLVAGIPENHFYDDLAPEARRAAGRVLRAAEALGLSTRAVRLPEMESASACRTVIAYSEAAEFHRARLAERPDDFGADVRALLRVGAALSAEEVAVAFRGRRLVTEALSRVLDRGADGGGDGGEDGGEGGGCDLLIVPTTPAGAPRVSAEILDNGEEARRGLMRLVAPFDLTGHPALSIPAGRDAKGMPLGAQLVGALGADALVIRVAEALEAAGQGAAPDDEGPPPGCYIPPDAP